MACHFCGKILFQFFSNRKAVCLIIYLFVLCQKVSGSYPEDQGSIQYYQKGLFSSFFVYEKWVMRFSTLPTFNPILRVLE